MKAFQFIGTSDLPTVNFNGNIGELKISGTSLPENVLEFFNPILNWIDNYKDEAPNQTLLELRFEYLNTASTNMVAKIVKSLFDLKYKSKSLTILWHYPLGDYDMKELGYDILEGLTCEYHIVEEEHELMQSA